MTFNYYTQCKVPQSSGRLAQVSPLAHAPSPQYGAPGVVAPVGIRVGLLVGSPGLSVGSPGTPVGYAFPQGVQHVSMNSGQEPGISPL